MNEQNRLRLDRIAARHASRAAQGPSEPEAKQEDAAGAAFLAAFDRVRDEVLRPVMAEVGVQLRGAGYLFRISAGGEASSPAVAFHVILPDRGDSKDTIRFLAHKDAERGWQVIGELELKRSPVELTRFETIDEITHDVVEQLVVDAVEQMFASVGGPPRSRGESPPLVLEAPPPPVPSEHASPSRAAEPPERVPTIESTPAPPAPAPPVELPTYEIAARRESTDVPERRWARWAGVQGVCRTENVSMFRRAALPFRHGPPAPAFFAAADATRAELRDRSARATGRETVPLSVLDAPGDEDGSDERDADGRAPPSLTVEQYAAFCAELEVFPGQAVQIHRTYRVAGAEARRVLDDAFAQRFRADPAVERKCRALVAHYAEWYRARAPR